MQDSHRYSYLLSLECRLDRFAQDIDPIEVKALISTFGSFSYWPDDTRLNELRFMAFSPWLPSFLGLSGKFVLF